MFPHGYCHMQNRWPVGKLIKNILLNYDEIIVMKDGMVIEKGSFDYLISLKGYFYSLYYLQNEDI